MFITLDNNSIIDVEVNAPIADTIRKLATEGRIRGYRLAVYSYLFLENQPRNSKWHELPNFAKRLDALGLGPIETLHPAGNPPLIDWVTSIIAPGLPTWQVYLATACAREGVSFEAVEEANLHHHPQRVLQAALARREITTPYLDAMDPGEREKLRVFWDGKHRTWNNRLSDVLALSAHIIWAGDGIFVTRDEHFLRKRDRVFAKIPTLRILDPKEALSEIISS